MLFESTPRYDTELTIRYELCFYRARKETSAISTAFPIMCIFSGQPAVVGLYH
jgi:hypothetical protein